MQTNYKKDRIDKKIVPEVLGNYIDTLKMYEKNNELSLELRECIRDLPTSMYLLKNMSDVDIGLTQETVEWAWMKLTGNNIIDELSISNESKELRGYYWWLSNGVVFGGSNHTTIIKQNLGLFSSLLDVNSMVLLRGLGGNSNELIGIVIKNGGVRVYIDSNKTGYFAMTGKTYGEWAKNKVSKIDLPNKIIKLIDINREYDGWDSGIKVII